KEQAEGLGADFDQVLSIDDLVRSEDVFFAATGITDGEVLKGVKYHMNWAETESLVTRSRSGTVCRIYARHHWGYKSREWLGEPDDRLLVLQHQSPAIYVGASKNLGDVTGLVTLRQDGGDRVWITLRRLQSGALGDQPVADHFASKAIFIVAPVRSHSVETDHEGGFASGAREIAGDAAGVLAIKDPLDRDAAQAPTDLSSESRAEFQETLLRLNRLVM